MRLLRIVVVILFVFSPSPPSEEGSPLPKKHDEKNKVSQTLSSDTKSSATESPVQPKRQPNITLPPCDSVLCKTKGIALKFRAWPVTKDEMSLLQEMKKQGLEKKMELLYSKVWIFEWSAKKYRNIIFTEMICKKLEMKIDTLEFCNLLIPSAPKSNRTKSL